MLHGKTIPSLTVEMTGKPNLPN